jgi:hypothetical protein
MDIVSTYPRAKLYTSIYTKVSLGLEGYLEGKIL